MFSVSTDTHFSHKAWHDSSAAIAKINYYMVGDQNHDLSNNFGILREGVGLADRGTFVVDPDGVIWENGMAKPAGSNVGEFEPLTLAQLAAQAGKTGGPINGHAQLNVTGAGPGFGVHLADLKVDQDTGQVTIARYTAAQMRADMAAYDADPTKYTQSLGCWHGFIAQQKLISIKKHGGGRTDRRYIYLSGWMIAALRSEFGPLPDQSMHEKTSVPALIEEIKRQTTASRREAFRQRGEKLAAAHTAAFKRTRQEAANGWDASPVSTARLAAELWAQIKTEWADANRHLRNNKEYKVMSTHGSQLVRLQHPHLMGAGASARVGNPRGVLALKVYMSLTSSMRDETAVFNCIRTSMSAVARRIVSCVLRRSARSASDRPSAGTGFCPSRTTEAQ